VKINPEFNYQTERTSPEPDFTWEDLMEARTILGWKYRQCWAHYEWTCNRDNWMVNDQENNNKYRALQAKLAAQANIYADNHQTFLVELKSGKRLFILFHDWTIAIGTTARLGDLSTHKVIKTTDF